MRYFSCDFETTTHPDIAYGVDIQSPGAPTTMVKKYPSRAEVKKRETEVWLAAASDCDNPDQEPAIQYSIDEFMNWVLAQGHCTCTFHNLHGFDRLFIINWAANHGYQLLTSADTAPDENHYVGSDKSFTLFTKRDGEWIVTNFIDSKLVLQGSVRGIGEQIGTYHKGDETPIVMHGTSIEDTPHADGSGYWTMGEAVEYIKNDVQVIASALNQMGLLAIWDSGMRTAASMAFNSMLVGGDIREHERVHRSEQPKAWHKCKDPDGVYEWVTLLTAFKPFGNNKKQAVVVGGRERDREKLDKITALKNHIVKNSYRGGFSYLNPVYIDQPIGEGVIIDINSMYPWIYSTMPLPRYASGQTTKLMEAPSVQAEETAQGKFRAMLGSLQKKIDKGKWPVITVTNLKAVCKPEYVPTIKPATKDKKYEQLKVIDENGLVRSALDGYTYRLDYTGYDLQLTWPDFDYLVNHYDIHAGFVPTVLFYEEDQELKDKLWAHCQYWGKVKQASKGAERLFAKMMLNSPYGKLAQYIKEYKESDFKLVNGRIVDDSDETNRNLSGKEAADLVTASYITAWGRRYLADTINKVGMDRFIYCDTDSIHIKGAVSEHDLTSWGVEVHDTELGKWAIEHRYDRAKYLKSKHYGYGDSEGWHTVASGYSRQIDEKDFKVGSKVNDLRPISAKGGTILLPVELELQPAWKDTFPNQKTVHGRFDEEGTREWHKNRRIYG